MRLSRIICSITVAGALVGFAGLLAAASDLTGRWTGASDQGPNFTFIFKTEGAKLTGSMLSREGKELPIQDGKLNGDTLSFSVESEWQGNAVKLVMKGKMAGDAIQLRIDTEDGAWGTDVTLKRAPAVSQP